jgi:UDP-glucose 4-epimerase
MGKILVTGGTGYIGSHTVVALQEMGHEVLIIDNLSNSNIKVVSQIAKITGKTPAFTQLDICDHQALMDYFSIHTDITGVIHFAAYKAVGESAEFPLKYYHNNLVSLINLLQAMQSIDCDNLVFSSSCTVYGQPEQLPVTESAPIQKAFSPYGNTKQISEEIISEHVGTSSLNAIALRYFNPIGAHESALIGELPLGVPNNLVPFITQTAIGKRKLLRVFGSDYNTPDGTCIRDYIHVMDLAKAHVVAVERLEKNLNSDAYEIFNLGTGNGFSVLEVLQTFEKVNNLKLNYEITDRRPGDVEQVWADTEKANKVLGWKAELGLEPMLKSAWDWENKLQNELVELNE